MSQLMKQASAHSKKEHNDNSLHKECESCLEIALAIVEESGADLEGMLEVSKKGNTGTITPDTIEALIKFKAEKKKGSAWD